MGLSLPMQQDIELALSLICERLPHLSRIPRRLNARRFKAQSRVLGRYVRLTDTLQLNARFLEPLDEPGALLLLDTLIHELLHAKDPLAKQIRDTFRPHPDVHEEAGRCCSLLADEFLAARRPAR